MLIDLLKAQLQCPQPTIGGGEPVTFTGPTDVTSDLTVKAQNAFKIDFQFTEGSGTIFVVRDANIVVLFTFEAQTGTDISQLPKAIDLVNKGLKKLVG